MRPWWHIHSTGRRWLDVVAVVLLAGVVGFLVFPIFAQAEFYSGPTIHGSLLSTSRALEHYAERNDGRLPIARTWMTDTGAHQPGRLPKREKGLGIAFFAPLSGVRLDAINDPSKVPMVFVSGMTTENANGSMEKLAFVGEGENRFTYVAFADGHVERMPYEWRLKTIVLEVGD